MRGISGVRSLGPPEQFFSKFVFVLMSIRLVDLFLPFLFFIFHPPCQEHTGLLALAGWCLGLSGHGNREPARQSGSAVVHRLDRRRRALQEEGLGTTGSLKKSFPPSISSIFTFFSQAELASLIAPRTLWKINSAVFEILERLGPSGRA